MLVKVDLSGEIVSYPTAHPKELHVMLYSHDYGEVAVLKDGPPALKAKAVGDSWFEHVYCITGAHLRFTLAALEEHRHWIMPFESESNEGLVRGRVEVRYADGDWFVAMYHAGSQPVWEHMKDFDPYDGASEIPSRFERKEVV